MQIEIFYLEEGDIEGLEKCNLFLRSNKILAVESSFASSQNVKWSILIRYIPGNQKKIASANTDRIDYKEVLTEHEFARYAKMRDARKVMSDEMQIPAYVIFTNEELSHLSKLEKLTLENISSVDGIGLKKKEKFGSRFIELFNQISNIQ
jgi:superfamily II DNA helicase RecQ